MFVPHSLSSPLCLSRQMCFRFCYSAAICTLIWSNIAAVQSMAHFLWKTLPAHTFLLNGFLNNFTCAHEFQFISQKSKHEVRTAIKHQGVWGRALGCQCLILQHLPLRFSTFIWFLLVANNQIMTHWPETKACNNNISAALRVRLGWNQVINVLCFIECKWTNMMGMYSVCWCSLF